MRQPTIYRMFKTRWNNSEIVNSYVGVDSKYSYKYRPENAQFLSSAFLKTLNDELNLVILADDFRHAMY
jgi:hypothetical protein